MTIDFSTPASEEATAACEAHKKNILAALDAAFADPLMNSSTSLIDELTDELHEVIDSKLTEFYMVDGSGDLDEGDMPEEDDGEDFNVRVDDDAPTVKGGISLDDDEDDSNDGLDGPN